MALCHDPTDPSNLTADERMEEITSILAAGVLRLHRHAAFPTASFPSGFPPDSAPTRLDDSRQTRLHGHRG
jgi:hypothetical protein